MCPIGGGREMFREVQPEARGTLGLVGEGIARRSGLYFPVSTEALRVREIFGQPRCNILHPQSLCPSVAQGGLVANTFNFGKDTA